MRNIAIGADHRGYAIKEYLQQNVDFVREKINWINVGTDHTRRTDYPEYAIKAIQQIKRGHAEGAVLLCGTGVGMAIAANRYPGIYAALVWNEMVARLAKQHDKANVLVLPSEFISPDEAVKLVHAWLDAEFLGDRYQDRIEMIDAIDPKKV